MSGPGAKGAKQRVRVYQDGKATYNGGGIQRKGMVDVDSRLSKEAKKVLIGLRIQIGQDIPINGFKLFGKRAGAKVAIPLVREAPGGTIATQLQAVAPDVNEKWIGYVADYDHAQHGKNGFTTELEVTPFAINHHGFQEVPIAFTYKDPAGNEFTAGHYIVGTSILPGADADSEPPPEHTPRGLTKTKKSKKKAVKKKKAARKRR